MNSKLRRSEIKKRVSARRVSCLLGEEISKCFIAAGGSIKITPRRGDFTAAARPTRTQSGYGAAPYRRHDRYIKTTKMGGKL